MIVTKDGYKYSVSDKNYLNEFVVVKVDDSTGKVVEARIIKAGSSNKVQKIILNGGFNNFPILEGSNKGQ